MEPADEPIYSHGDRQIARILHRAAELQAQAAEKSGPLANGATGLSLTELKQIAGEVGIDPRYVEAAAAELREGNAGDGRFYLWGAPVSATLERVVEGEVSPEEWETLIARVREITGRVGKPSTLGRSLEWVSQTEHVSVSPKDGRTTLRVLVRYADIMVVAYLPMLTGIVVLDTFVVAGLGSAPLEALGVGAAVTGGMFWLARRWAESMVRSHRNKMKALLRELAEHVERTALPGPGERVLSEQLAVEGDSIPAHAVRTAPQQSSS